jgi:molecular chaperone GrpE
MTNKKDTKKDAKKNIKENDKELNELKEKLEKEVSSKKCEEELSLLEKENEKLKKQLQEKEEIIKNTQLQYISLKNEFDAFTNRVKQQEEKTKQELFEKNILAILPILELFEVSYDHIPDEFKNHKWTEWLDIINKKIMNFLKENNIEVIPTIGQEVDETLHEVIWMQNASEENKWKIIQEVKKWYILKTKDWTRVLQPAKVVIWQ